jgi:predicted polyphosphate/ATP-dependent NAD kinase
MPRPVGITANPFSGTDIRRVVAYAATSNNWGKVQILQRVLVGLAEAGVREVLYMPDPSNLVRPTSGHFAPQTGR